MVGVEGSPISVGSRAELKRLLKKMLFCTRVALHLRNLLRGRWEPRSRTLGRWRFAPPSHRRLASLGFLTKLAEIRHHLVWAPGRGLQIDMQEPDDFRQMDARAHSRPFRLKTSDNK